MAYRVFLSSTSKDLAEHREAVLGAIARLDGFSPIAMENFGARDLTASQIDEAKIRECEVFLGLVGHCYGSSPAGNPISYTEQEYDRAKALGRPRLMLVASNDFPLPARLIEPEDKRRRQEVFRSRVLEERVVALFDEAGRLQSLATQALANWRAEREQVDRIMADLVAAKEAAARHEARAAELERRLGEGQETLRAAVQALADKAREPDPPPQAQQALALLSQGDTAKAEAIFAEIVARKEAEGAAALQEAAAAARHLGALTYLDSTEKAIAAYATATRLDPGHAWSWILLGRLHQRAGSLASAGQAFQKAREAAEQAGSERDVMVADNSIGDVRVAQGDRAGALEAYEQGRAIRETLAGRDPNNAEWQRELIVTHWRLADLAEQREDPDAARHHWQAALEIAHALVANGRLAPVDGYIPAAIEARLVQLGRGSSP